MQAHLPIAKELGICVNSYDADCLVLTAPLEPNINDKLTAFGGSIYCVCVMSCWGMVYLKAKEHGLLSPSIVVSKGQIDYLQPVAGQIRASCQLNDTNQFDDFFKTYDTRGRAKITLKASVMDKGKEAVQFTGHYALLG
jgi:thioesterase domain-containing protein